MCIPGFKVAADSGHDVDGMSYRCGAPKSEDIFATLMCIVGATALPSPIAQGDGAEVGRPIMTMVSRARVFVTGPRRPR
jgi:hypothetical protein